MNSSPVRSIRRALATTRGANMVEYIILVGVVALMCIIAFGKFSSAVTGKVAEQSGTVKDRINGEAKEPTP